MNLDELRGRIDNIDNEMCRLFAERMQVVTDIARYKKENNLAVYHPSRARAVLQNISKQLGPEFEGYGRSLYHTIFDLSESYQTRMLSTDEDFFKHINEITSKPPIAFPKRASVACAGCEGAYANLAAERLFDLEEGVNASFAVRIINIPEKHEATILYARAYYVFEYEGREVVVYDDVQSANYINKYTSNDGVLEW